MYQKDIKMFIAALFVVVQTKLQTPTNIRMGKWIVVCSTQIIHTQQTKWTKYNYIQWHRCILQNNVEQNISDTKEYILFYPIYREFKRDKQWIMLKVRIMATFGKLSHILFFQVAQSVKRICLQCRRLPAVQETWVQSLDQEDSAEKEMANHSNILAWEIPWTEKPSALQSKLQWVGHD